MAIFQIEMFSNSLKHHTPLVAIVPAERLEMPGFQAQDRDAPFRTIYLLHGYSGSQLDWLHGSRIVQLALLFNVAVIMPACGNGFYLDDEVRGELYEKYICEELIEFTRRVFPLSQRREDTTIAGLSMGGYGALRNGLKRSDVFGSIFAFSSALITDGIAGMKEGDANPVAPYSYYRHVFGDLDHVVGGPNDPKALARKAVAEGLAIPKIFMACGTEDFLLASNRDFKQCLDTCGIDCAYHESAGIHDWRFWDEYIEKAMEWQYGKPVNPFQR